MNFEQLKPELIKFLKAYKYFAKELKDRNNEIGIVNVYLKNYNELNDL